MGSTWLTGNGHCFAAGRIAYSLGLGGPCLAVDTACSSSLTALHLASKSLADRECDVAVTAGINLVLSGQSTAEIARTGALSPTGRCRPFDANADGFVRGEGCVALILQRLDDAQRDGARILGVIEASGVNQDGPSAGFTAPNPLAQTALLRSTLGRAGLQPHDVGIVQAHGTGTPLGDPIELEAIAEAFGDAGGVAPRVTSAKANFGHLEAAAGLLGVAAAVVARRADWIPPQANLEVLNPRAPKDGRIVVPAEGAPWSAELGTRAVVESFGMSGTNACVVIGPAPGPEAPGQGPQTNTNDCPPGLLLSGHDREAVARQAARLAAAVKVNPETDWDAITETLWYGRERLAVSILVHINGTSPLDTLRAVAAGEAHPLAQEVSGLVESARRGPQRVVDLPPYPWSKLDYVTPPRG